MCYTLHDGNLVDRIWLGWWLTTSKTCTCRWRRSQLSRMTSEFRLRFDSTPAKVSFIRWGRWKTSRRTRSKCRPSLTTTDAVASNTRPPSWYLSPSPTFPTNFQWPLSSPPPPKKISPRTNGASNFNAPLVDCRLTCTEFFSVFQLRNSGRSRPKKHPLPRTVNNSLGFWDKTASYSGLILDRILTLTRRAVPH